MTKVKEPRGALANCPVSIGEPLLRSVATAVVLLARRQAPGDPVYDDEIQRAYNSLGLHFVLNGAEAPASVPDMIRWAAKTPLREWPGGFSSPDIDGDEFLVDAATRTPTRDCMEWAMTVPDVTAELLENKVLDDALTACRIARSPASYAAFRKLLITKPVMTTVELTALSADIDLMPVFEIIRRSYEPANAAYLRNGSYWLCDRCGCMLIPLSGGGYQCELDRCRNDGRAALGREIPAGAGMLQLARPLRVFVTSPGIAETDLEAALAKLGLQAEMWPEFDAYDLRVPFPDGTAWAVDVKDWANPSLLASGMHELRHEPRYDKAFIVVPEHRFQARENYARAFRHRLAPELADRVSICSDAEFLSLTRRALRRAKRQGSEGTANGGRGHA